MARHKLIESGLILAVISCFSTSVSAQSAEKENNSLAAAGQAYATAYGVSPDEGSRRVLIMNKGDEIGQQVSEAIGNQLSGAFFAHDGNLRMSVRTTGNGNQDLQSVTVDTEMGPQTIPIEYLPGSTRNRRAIENILSNQGKRLAKQIEGVQGLGYDPQSDRIVVDIYLPDSQSLDMEMENDKLSKISGMETVINVLPVPITTGAVRGGANLSGGGFICTAGFSATRNGVQGMVTAAHCRVGTTSSFAYSDALGTAHTLSNFHIPSSGNHDLMWAKSNGGAIGDVFVTASSYRAVTGTRFRSSTNTNGWFSSGSQVCHYGRTTGQSCGEVQKINYRPTYTDGCTAGTGNCNSVFVSVEGPNLACAGGDSGGPWFAYNTAFGVHSAGGSSGTNPGQCAIAIYSSVDWIDSGLGASIMFNP